MRVCVWYGIILLRITELTKPIVYSQFQASINLQLNYLNYKSMYNQYIWFWKRREKKSIGFDVRCDCGSELLFSKSFPWVLSSWWYCWMYCLPSIRQSMLIHSMSLNDAGHLWCSVWSGYFLVRKISLSPSKPIECWKKCLLDTNRERGHKKKQKN